MSHRPDLPKRLSVTIRRVQEEVTSARYSILCDEKRIEQDGARIAEFEADPAAFAAKYYGRHDVDSYPVQTNISRSREDLEYRLYMRAGRQECLQRAEAELKNVVVQVLTEVMKMRPSRGRVLWPAPLPSFDVFRTITLRRWDREARADEAWRAREQAKYDRLQDAEDARAAEEAEREFQRARAEVQEMRARMSPEERQAEEVGSRALISALKAGTITFAEILAYLQSRP